MGTDQASPSRLVLSVAALTIGTLVVAIEAYLIGYLDYVLSTFADEWVPMLVRVLLVSAPFLLLAKRGVTAPMPWAVGLALTVLVWGYVIFKYLSGGFEDGTSVGISMWLALVALGSSAGITIICALLSRNGRKAPQASSL
jgi:hypothetical protein